MFSQWASKVEATRLNRRPSSRSRDQSLLNSLILPEFGDRTLAGVDPMDIRRWVATLEQSGYAPATISKAYQIVSRAFRVAVTDGIITRSPCREVKLPRIETPERRFLSPGEVEDLADTIDTRYRTLVLTGAYTGLRFGEIAALRTDDLDPLRRTLRVDEQLSRQGTGRMVSSPLKTRKARRTLGIPRFLTDELVAHLATYPSSSDLIFSMTQGGPLDYNRFRSRYWNPAVDASVGPPCTPHDLRHTHVAMLIAQGESPKYIADRLGHESTRTVFDVYGHLYDGVDEAATDRLEQARNDSRSDRTKRGPEVIKLPARTPNSLIT
jgi:integrase